jgi:ribonuclease R
MFKLTRGILRKDIPRDKRNLVNDLITLGIVENGKVVKLREEYRVGEIDITKKGFGFLIPIGVNEKDYLIEIPDLHGAGDGDLVIAKLLHRKKRGRKKAEVIYLLEKKFPVRIVYLEFMKRGGTKIPILRNIKTKEPIFVKKQKQLKKLPEGAVLKIDNYTNQILEVLGVLSDPWVDEKISLGLYNKREEFSKRAILEAESFGDRVEREFYPHRIDLTHLPFVTIDPEGAKDHDDAIYFDPEKRELFVAIADVSEYVYPNGAIDREAKERGFSIYFPHKAVPMLPPQLSENLCSLREGEDRLAFVFKISFNPQGEVVDTKLFEGIINSRRKYTYDRIDELLEYWDREKEGKKGFLGEPEDEIDREIGRWLHPLSLLTAQLRQERLKGGLTFESDEIRMKLDENGELAEVKLEEETRSHQLIEECMLLANRGAAEMVENGIYRVHDEPSPTAVTQLMTLLEELGIEVKKGEKRPFPKVVEEIQEQAEEMGLRRYVDKLIIKAQQQAEYSGENRGHFALGFESYTHFTSPIRRYSDLLLHRILKALLRGEKRQLDYLSREVEAVAERLSQLEREAQRVEWDFYDRKFARWGAKHIGEEFEGIIEDPEIPPIARLDDEIFGARIFLEDREKFPLFQRVKFQITQSDIPTAKISGKVTEKLATPYPLGEPISLDEEEEEENGENR